MWIAHLDAPMRSLAALAALDDGWNYGRGLAPTVIARLNSRAATLIASVAGATKFEFFPEDDGGILTIAYLGDESAEILARSDGKFEFAFENKDGLSPARELANIAEVKLELERCGWQLQKSSDSFTRVITASERVGTRLLPSDPVLAVCRSSIPDALLRKGIRVAPMRSVTTNAELEAHRPYFGESEPRNLLTATS